MKFGALVVDGRNKIGGQVASKNRAGAYLRNKVTPVNPQSVAQSNVRNRFGGISQAWRGLTEAQRTAWNAAVQDFGRTDIFGDIRNPSGAQLHQRLNQELSLAGASLIVLPPLVGETETISALSATAAAGTPALSVVFGPSPVPANTAYIVEATPQVSPGKSFVKNLYRRIGQIAPAATTPFDALSAYTARFGALVAGQKLFIRVKTVNLLTGITSPYMATTVIVAS